MLDDLKFDLLNVFGSQVYDKAKKVEAAGTVGNDLYFAGQGSIGSLTAYEYDDDAEKLAKVKVDGVKSISGNIVGTIDAPTCYNCCADEPVAGAFALCDVWPEGGTAAYGTFSLKYNSSKTKKNARGDYEEEEEEIVE